MSSSPFARRQNLRVLAGRFALTRMTDIRSVAIDADLLAFVVGPDGGASMRRDDTAGGVWVALWNGDDAHDPEATGMLSAIVMPLAAGGLPVWTAASYDGDSSWSQRAGSMKRWRFCAGPDNESPLARSGRTPAAGLRGAGEQRTAAR